MWGRLVIFGRRCLLHLPRLASQPRCLAAPAPGAESSGGCTRACARSGVNQCRRGAACVGGGRKGVNRRAAPGPCPREAGGARTWRAGIDGARKAVWGGRPGWAWPAGRRLLASGWVEHGRGMEPGDGRGWMGDESLGGGGVGRRRHLSRCRRRRWLGPARPGARTPSWPRASTWLNCLSGFVSPHQSPPSSPHQCAGGAVHFTRRPPGGALRGRFRARIII